MADQLHVVEPETCLGYPRYSYRQAIRRDLAGVLYH